MNIKKNSTEKNPKKKTGFAAMDPERQRQIASEGGRAAHRQGVAYEWTAEEARAAGTKGGEARAKKNIHKRKRNDS
jgi:uncharacterized protein